MKKIKEGDTVMVIAGKFKGTQSTVLAAGEQKVLVKGVNIVKKWVKGEWLIEKEAPIHISNVALYDPKKERPSKVGIKDEKGKKVRYLKASWEKI